MDMSKALNLWTDMGHTFKGVYGEGTYKTAFMKDGKEVGNITAHTGQGVSWEFPQELIERYKEEQ